MEPVQPGTARRADALAWMAEGFLASEPNTLTGGDRPQIVVHIDAQTLKHDHPGRCGLEDGPGMATETARRRALNSRDRGCRFPGCTHSRFVDGHHVQHWAQGGQTKLANLASLDGAFRFIRPDGRSFDSDSPGELEQLDGMQWVAAHQARRPGITPRTAITGWRGEAR